MPRTREDVHSLARLLSVPDVLWTLPDVASDCFASVLAAGLLWRVDMGIGEWENRYKAAALIILYPNLRPKRLGVQPVVHLRKRAFEAVVEAFVDGGWTSRRRFFTETARDACDRGIEHFYLDKSVVAVFVSSRR